MNEPIQAKEKNSSNSIRNAEQVNYLTFFLLAKSFASHIMRIQVRLILSKNVETV